MVVLLVEAVTRPGVISTAYSQFWHYSVGNQFLALFQCHRRKIEPGPIHTFRGWLDLGRHVKKGERALTLCMPVSVRRSASRMAAADPGPVSDKQPRPESDESNGETFTRFVYRNHWFVLSQTKGDAYEPVQAHQWSEVAALDALKITRVAFNHLDGNCQGYALGRDVAVSPIAFMPHRTLFHEMAHVLLGHTSDVSDGEVDGSEPIARSLREAEAESVALICSESLGLPGAEFSRGYIQHWLKQESIPDRSAQRIFKAADEILRAGRSAEPE